jgi:DnaJ-class molecular chaperone
MSDHAEDKARAATENASAASQSAIEVTALRVTPDADGRGGVTLELRTADGTPTFHLSSTRAMGLFLDFFPPASATCRPCRGTGKANNGNYCLQCGGGGQA